MLRRSDFVACSGADVPKPRQLRGAETRPHAARPEPETFMCSHHSSVTNVRAATVSSSAMHA